ncbi:MAG: exonuclease domain-containing protein [Planctomycetota bacterium]|nr:exonuclease domain-containing protein [Planctomycetota bacterium]
MTRPIVAFDTETATSRGAPHLIEIAAVRAVGGEIVDRFEAFVRPEVPIEAAVTEVHGLVDDDVRDAETAGVVLARFTQWAGEDWLVAHNASFDAAVLAFEAERYGVELSTAPILDSLKLARRFIADSPDHKLGTLVEHLELDVGRSHRALPDAVACWLVFEECRARSGLDETTWWGEAVGRGGRTTFRGSRPRMPRLTQRLRGLEAACRERVRVTVVYGDGENAPARLAIVPRLFFESGERSYLEAECVRSGLLKTYRLDRIQRVEAG